MANFEKRLFDSREPSGYGLFSKLTKNSLQSSTSLQSGTAMNLLSPSRKRKQPQKLEVEPMEPRILLSADLAPFAVAMMADQNELTLSHDITTDLIQVHDTFSGDLVAEQLRAETSSVVITGTEGDDRLVMDMAGTYMFPGGMLFDGAGGTDELVGPDVDTTWIVDGVDSGSMEAFDFVDVEKLIGGAGNEDLFYLLAGGQSTGGLEGGAGGLAPPNR